MEQDDLFSESIERRIAQRIRSLRTERQWPVQVAALRRDQRAEPVHRRPVAQSVGRVDTVDACGVEHLGRERDPWLIRATLITAAPGTVYRVDQGGKVRKESTRGRESLSSPKGKQPEAPKAAPASRSGPADRPAPAERGGGQKHEGGHGRR